MKNGNRRGFGWFGVVVLLILSGFAIMVIAVYQSSHKELGRDEALTVQTITGLERVEQGDIIATDAGTFRFELGKGKEANFTFVDCVYSDGSHDRFTHTLSEFNRMVSRWLNNGWHPRLVKAGTPKHEELSAQIESVWQQQSSYDHAYIK